MEGQMEVVPETKMKGPRRTAREYPNLDSLVGVGVVIAGVYNKDGRRRFVGSKYYTCYAPRMKLLTKLGASPDT